MHPRLLDYLAKYSEPFTKQNLSMRPWVLRLIQNRELASALKESGSGHGGSFIDCTVPWSIASSQFERAQKRQPQDPIELVEKESILRAITRASEHGLVEQWRIWERLVPSSTYQFGQLSELFKSERMVRAGFVRHQVQLGITHSSAKSRQSRLRAKRDQLARSVLIWDRVRLKPLIYGNFVRLRGLPSLDLTPLLPKRRF